MKKKTSKKRFLLPTALSLVVFLGLLAASAILWPSNKLVSIAGGVLYLPYKAIDAKKCETVEFYLNEEVVEDSDMLEGEIVQTQDKKPGKKQHCYSYLRSTTETIVLSQPTPSIVKVGTKKYKDPQLLALAPLAGIRSLNETDPVSIYYVDNYSDFLWAAGQYSDYKKAITVSRESNSHTATLAHEYLHYVWYRDELEKNNRLTRELASFYNNSHDLRQRMNKYSKEMIRPTEFFSYGCTEWADARLTPYILQFCEQYIVRGKQQIHYY